MPQKSPSTPQIFSLIQLRAFVLAADLESFTRAGEHLGITQGAVSILIRRLEDDLRVTLFVRRGRFFLTEAGRRALPHARQSVDSASEAVAAVASVGGSLPDDESPPLRVGRLGSPGRDQR